MSSSCDMQQLPSSARKFHRKCFMYKYLSNMYEINKDMKNGVLYVGNRYSCVIYSIFSLSGQCCFLNTAL